MCGIFSGSWFIVALIWGMTIFFILKKLRVADWIQLCLSVLVYSWVHFCLLFTTPESVIWVIYMSFKSFFNGHLNLSFFESLVWINIGYLLSGPKFQNLHLGNMSRRINMVAVLELISLYFAIYLILQHTGLITIIRIIASALVVIFVYPINLPKNNIWLYLRKYSILIFFFHFIILRLYPLICHSNAILQHPLVKYGIVLLLCLTLSHVIVRLSSKINLLKYLY